MDKLAPDQRNDYYLIEANRTGLHKPLLAALYAVQGQPPLADGETGLGLISIHQVDLAQVDTFGGQVQFAANTLRRLIQQLINQGWAAADLWNASAGRYSDRFLRRVATGYIPTPEEPDAAHLEACEASALRQAYLEDLAADYGDASPPQGMAQLDPTLLAFAERVPPNYSRLESQRQALVEAVRLWRQWDDRAAVYAELQVPVVDQVPEESALDQALLAFIQDALRHYSGYPNQREALLRLVQLWRKLDSREAAIVALLESDPFAQEAHLPIIDPALIAAVQRIPRLYRGQGDQRLALTEGYRRWFGLASRNAALERLGINPETLVANADNPGALAGTAQILDRALLDFVQSIPSTYQETPSQREALIGLVQRWRRLEDRTATVQALIEEVRCLERSAPTSPDAMPVPVPLPLPARPPQWTPQNLQLAASIVPNGHFTWAEATQGGVCMPPNQAAVDAIVRMAQLAQQARDRLGRPLIITRWYGPTEIPRRVGGPGHRRPMVGDAIDVYCVGLTGNQVYWFLDPWWPGGLGRYRHYPDLVHLDARPERARWTD
ncbi:MAG: D-Ala-D-Ala carboxypeptidase family metallohydrolase [Leptolyngbya sp.]|nr:D-Ala-D-Ala carboxypeptidase family metallohydrolase [Leptolyngbya sp.]